MADATTAKMFRLFSGITTACRKFDLKTPGFLHFRARNRLSRRAKNAQETRKSASSTCRRS